MASSIQCGVQSLAALRVPAEEIAALRQRFNGRDADASGKHVRVSDEQTVLCLAALTQARDPHTDYGEWGVLASALHFGRARFASALERFRKFQARGASPMVVPHLCLHAISGTLSLALGMHGPHFGISGGSGHLAETLFLGLSALHRERIPGLWLVASELTVGSDGQLLGQAVALGIVPSAQGNNVLSVKPGSTCLAPADLTSLVDHVLNPEADRDSWSCALPGIGALELQCGTPAILERAA